MVDQRSQRFFPVPSTRVALLALLTLTASCSTTADQKGRDGSGFYPTARFTYEVGEIDPKDRDPIHPEESSKWTLEGEATFGSGELDDFDYDITEATVGGKLRWATTERSQYDVLVGAAFNSTELDTNGVINATDIDASNVGPYLGVEARYRTSDSFGLYGRAQFAWLFSDATSLRAEIGSEIDLGGSVDLLIGYRWWRYIFDEDDTFSSSSDAEFLLRGLVVGVQVSL